MRWQEVGERKVFLNGNVVTMEKNGETADAFYVEKGVFRAVGSIDTVMQFAGQKTEFVDLMGKTVLPGFIESHMHVLSLGMLLRDINHNDCRSIAELIEHSREHIRKSCAKPGAWVRGRGWNQDRFSDESRFLTRYDLDKISKIHPLAFTRTCGHVVVVNSKALEIMGMCEHAQQVEGGQIDLDEHGIPLGIFREQARACVLERIPEQTQEELQQLVRLALDEAASHGITEIHTDDFKDVRSNFQKVIDAYTELRNNGELKARIYQQCNLPSMKLIHSFLEAGYKTGFGDEMFRLGPLKLLADGSLGARTALLSTPYSDDPSTRGISLFSQDELDAMIGACHRAGMQVAIHAIGDGAVDMVLDGIERAKTAYPRKNERHGIIHCQITRKEQIKRIRELELIAYIQPVFLNYDLDIVEDRIGMDRAASAYEWKTLIDSGIICAGGSDCPVESLNVMENIYTAVLRKNLKGFPESGWRTEQNLTLYDTLKLFTVNGAYASFSEDVKGSIAPGKYADFAVLEKDIFQIPLEEIKHVKVAQTYLGGELTYDRALQRVK